MTSRLAPIAILFGLILLALAIHSCSGEGQAEQPNPRVYRVMLAGV